ncbi:biotin--[acetyl-CoA-carboxylase] ligase [Pasteurellaceae bacterium HPA106]|uniref:biotin--[acetyl-CoA-carboxylase] ligase n=1 Tax=Spirabiliibacterium pneumoniae TaxID=221400 RepID=UPI001AAD9B68|nr:biotin--[acetyl-CoA-carboxylase] ligase [Spirabiliibacterium pneumoniae]MBE2896046.1 biotin--[acetyl-CoA-carboxylase] ligase [Spirabiliibacterium pneumoniae]
MSEPTPELLDAQYLRQALGDTTVLIFKEIDSTNAYLLREQAPHNTLCTAETQTAGRGRRGRVWHSPFAQNLYFSLRWDFTQLAPHLPKLSLLTALCIAQTLRAQGVSNVALKWPNDIYLDDRKLGGILIETQKFSAQHQHMVIGIGLNLAMQAVQQGAITQPWASLAQSHLTLSRNALLVALVSALKECFAHFQAQKGMLSLAAFVQFDCFLNRNVRLLQENRHIDGVYRGIDPDSGEAIIDTQGQRQRFHIGEISLRLHEE